MASAAEIRALIAEVKGIAVEVAGDLDEVIEKLNNPDGITAADAQAIALDVSELRDQLRGVADKVPEPVVEPPVEG